MQRNFKLNDDTLMEIFGYLSAADVLQCRRVCQRMSRVTREHTLWTTIYRRSRCPLPTLDRTLPVAKLEKLVNRAEVLDAKWTNPHPTISNVRDSLTFPGVLSSEHSVCVGIRGPYVIFLRLYTRRGNSHRRALTFHWYKIGDANCTSLDPVYQYDCAKPPNVDFPSQSALDNGLSYEMDPETGTLYVASVYASGETLFLTSIKPGEKFEMQPQALQTSLWRAASYHGVKIVNGFVLCSQSSWSESQIIEIVCIRTGKKTRALIRSKFPPKTTLLPGGAPASYKTSFAITPHHFVRILDGNLIEVFDLPDMSGATGYSGVELDTPSMGQSRPSFSGSFPHLFTDIYVFPSPRPSTLVIIGAGGPDSLGPGRTYKVALMTLDMTKHSIHITNELTMSGVAVEADRRLTLTHHPTTLCIVGIAVTRTSARSVYDSAAAFTDPDIYQSLKYVKVLLDTAGNPTMIVNELDIPGQVANKMESFMGVDVYNGRIIFKYHHAVCGEGQKKFGLLDYLRTFQSTPVE